MTSTKPDLSMPTCRACLENSKDQEMFSIFDLDEDLDDIFIYEKMEQCAGIEVLREENLPSFICDNCYGLLRVAYQFRLTCRNSEELLKKILTTQPIRTKTEQSNQNPLSIKDDTSKRKGTRSETNKLLTNVSSPMLECIKNELIISPDSPINFEEPIADNFEDYDGNVLCFDTNYNNDDDNTLHGDEDTKVSVEQINLDAEEEKVKPPRNVRTNNRKKVLGGKAKKPAKARSKELKKSCGDDEDETTDEKTAGSKKEKKEKRPHICEICGNKFQHRYSLKSHIKRHLNEKSFNCEICGYSCHSNIELVRHLRRHTGSKPYKCRYCTRAFGDQSTLVKHERVHRNERPFKCDICGKSFSYTGVLNCHKLVHTGEKPYKCEICGKCFTTRHHLRSHLKTIQHQNDSRVETLLQNIRKNNESEMST